MEEAQAEEAQVETEVTMQMQVAIKSRMSKRVSVKMVAAVLLALVAMVLLPTNIIRSISMCVCHLVSGLDRPPCYYYLPSQRRKRRESIRMYGREEEETKLSPVQPSPAPVLEPV